MSIDLITGVPGSGKTYFAVSKLKKVYDTKERPIYTNINLKVPFDDYLHKLDIKQLYDIAKQELNLHNDFKKLLSSYNEIISKTDSIEYSVDSRIRLKVDDDLKSFEYSLSSHQYRKNFVANHNNYDDYAKASGILADFIGSLIVWDECQNDLDELDPVWIRFFSYHRHFSIDIILITQDLSLIDRKYKAFFDKFYYGQNATKRFFSNVLRYKVYNDSREYKKFFIENISLKMQKDIFNFYDSGSYEVGKSQFAKFLIVPAVLIPFLYFGFNFLFPSSSAPVQNIDKNSTNVKDVQLVQEPFQNSDLANTLNFKDENKLIELHCNKTYCFMINSRFNVPVAALEAFVAGYEGEILYKDTYSNSISKVYISLPQSRYEDLVKFRIVGDDFGGDKFSQKDKFNKGVTNEGFKSSSFNNGVSK